MYCCYQLFCSDCGAKKDFFDLVKIRSPLKQDCCLVVKVNDWALRRSNRLLLVQGKPSRSFIRHPKCTGYLKSKSKTVVKNCNDVEIFDGFYLIVHEEKVDLKQ